MNGHGSSGRGRGVSNKPAWMSSRDDRPGDSGKINSGIVVNDRNSPGPGVFQHRPPHRGGGGGSSRGCPGPGPGGGFQPPFPGPGGGGRPPDDFPPHPHRHHHRHNSRDRDRRGGPPPPHHGGGDRYNRGGGRIRDDDLIDNRRHPGGGPPFPNQRPGGGPGFPGPGGRGVPGGGNSIRQQGPPPNAPPRLRGSALREEHFPRFRSYQEERQYVEERREKRRTRETLFDKEPSPEEKSRMEQMEILLRGGGIGAGVAGVAPGSSTAAGVATTGDIVAGAALDPSSSSSAAVVLTGMVPSIVTPSTAAAVMPQQTRHARRLYVGNLPQQIDETEIHTFFRHCIDVATGKKQAGDDSSSSRRNSSTNIEEDDPILSVYINRERLFAFVEFRTMEMTNSCMLLDGINLNGKGQIRVKRPNDYNPALAPNPNVGIPNFDISKLGLVSGTVQDGPNKIFIGGLPYHWNEAQIMELVGAFGTLKAFHLVKETTTSLTSKGYCFVEFVDPNNTAIAVAGLNGMELGEGKSLTARIAARNASVSGADSSTVEAAIAASMEGASAYNPHGFGLGTGTSSGGAVTDDVVPPSSLMMSAGATDSVSVSNTVDALLNAALGGVDPAAGSTATSSAPVLPQTTAMITGAGAVADASAVADMAAAYLNQALPPAMMTGASTGGPPFPPTTTTALTLEATAEQVANEALNAAFANTTSVPPEPSSLLATTTTNGTATTGNHAVTVTHQPSRILVLKNAVMEDDLATDENHQDLKEEIKEECEKYGTLLSIQIPRDITADGKVASSAIKKIFLEYKSVEDAVAANQQLSGRQFGPNTVQTAYFDDSSYQSGILF